MSKGGDDFRPSGKFKILLFQEKTRSKLKYIRDSLKVEMF